MYNTGGSEKTHLKYSDTIKAKREAAKLKKEQEEQRKEILENTQNVAAEVARQAAKTRTSTQSVKVENPTDMSGVMDSINKLNLTTFVSTHDKYTEMANRVAELSEDLTELANNMKTSGQAFDSSMTKAVEQIAKTVKELAAANSGANQKELKNELKQVVSAIKAIDVRPEITVQAPDVKVQAPKAPDVVVDTKPISDMFSKYLDKEEAEPLELENFKAQDLDNENGSMQYVGFVNPDGLWYIIENDVDGNSLRYKFGKSNYSKAWTARVATQYKLLNEAINEVRS